MKKNARNIVFTPYQPSCRLCRYAGFSNICNLSQNGTCLYVSFREDIGSTAEKTELGGEAD